MANPPPRPASIPNANTSPPSTPLHSGVPVQPQSPSYTDESDAEFNPTPLQSPGGPAYDDLPPSYDESRHQAISDARQGVAPLDPNQIEAHRLTINEGPNEPEIWEYRVRGEELDGADELEQAPEYANITNNQSTTVPVQHVSNSETIPVGRVERAASASNAAPDPAADLLTRALEFTRHEPDPDAKYAPRLARRIAVPQQELDPVQFSRVYAKALHAHSIRPAEFVEFLDGLNALCMAAGITFDDLLIETPITENTSNIVHDYIRGVNEAFFAPRGLRVSLRSFSELVEALAVPGERGQRAGAIASVLDHESSVRTRARALHPWIEAVETDVPAPSTRSLMLRETIECLRSQGENEGTKSADSGGKASLVQEDGDPPHSALDAATEHDPASRFLSDEHARNGRERGGMWSPFGAPGRGPFGAPGRGPFGAPGNSPFGGLGRGPFGSRGRSSFGHPGSGSHGRSGCSPSHAADGNRSDQPANEWAAMGQDIGKWGEEFGKRMGDWGQQFGKQASAWGQNVGKEASVLGQDIGQRASGSGPRRRLVPTSAQLNEAMPPSYDEGPYGQETGVFRGDSKTSHDPPSYEDNHHGKSPAKDIKGDDTSSISSDSSNSDSELDSDSDDEAFPNTQATFLKRIRSINEQAEAAALKGKKTPEEIHQEHSLAIEKATNDKIAMDRKIGEKVSKRATRRALKQKRRDLVREYRHKKRELRSAHVGKGKSKAKKTPEWKQARKEYREKRKELLKEKTRLRKEEKEGRSIKTVQYGADGDREQQEMMDAMVWVIIDNLDA
jgi:hypothetical protein